MPSLAFKRGDLEDAIKDVRKAKNPGWPVGLRQDEEDSWDKVMLKRITTMLRHVAQARLQKRAWVEQLLGASQPEAAAAAAAAGGEQQGATFFGYDPALRAAWRKVGDGPKEFSSDWVDQKGALETDPASVQFKGGEIRSVHELTVADLRLLLKPRKHKGKDKGKEASLPVKGKEVQRKGKEVQRKGKEVQRKGKVQSKVCKVKDKGKDMKQTKDKEKGEDKQKTERENLWEGIHKPTGDRLRIATRADRGMLTVLYQGPSMICGVQNYKFPGPAEALGSAT